MNKEIATELLDWVVITILVPFALPLLFALCWGIFYNVVDVFSLIELLFNNGVYTFFVLMILISLFQDYRVVPNAFSIFLWLSIMVCSFFTFIIFASFLDFIPKPDLESPIVITLPLLSLALFFKFRIIQKKYTKYKNKNL